MTSSKEHNRIGALHAAVAEAAQRIRPLVRVTPLEHSPALSDQAGCSLFLKMENVQVTGSFKARGAVNKLLCLGPEQRTAGVVTASTGNHGLAVAYGVQKLGIRGTIFLPENVPPHRIAALRRYPVELRLFGNDCALTEQEARRHAQTTGAVYISPYNDLDVVAGQGSVAVELEQELGRMDWLFVAVGGGGLIAGCAAYLKERGHHTHVVGCLPANSPTMYECIKAGRIVEVAVQPTLSDATAGGIEPGAITFPLCQKLVDDWVLVSEEQIGAAIRLLFEEHRLVIEGAAGVAVAGALSYLQRQHRASDTRGVVIVCGGNIAIERLKELVCA